MSYLQKLKFEQYFINCGTMQEQVDAFNLLETQKVQKRVEYKRYVEWLKENGVIMDPRVRYPSCFGNSQLVGVSASKNIEKGKAIVGIPYRIIITVDKVKSVEELSKIINENPDIFSSVDDRAFMILLLYVVYELMKVEKSFYYPYFCIADGSMVTNWSHWELIALENKQIAANIKQLRDQVQMQFLGFLRLFRRYQTIFPAEIPNGDYKQLFQRAYGIITTRAFGWSLPSISIIPLADSFNHGHTYVDHYLINTKFQEEGKGPQTYALRKNKVNLKIFSEKLTLTPQQLEELRKPKVPKRLKFINIHKQIIKDQPIPLVTQKSLQLDLQFKILHQQYKAQVRNLRQLHFYPSSCSQDNDTDQQTIYERTYKEQSFLTEEKYGKRTLNNANKKNIVLKYWKPFIDEEFNPDVQSESEEEQVKNEKENEIIRKESQGSEVVSSSSDQQEQDEKFDWTNESNINDLYFVMQSKASIRENQQIYNFYGRRSNKFLLLGYNFTLYQNCYDSFPLRFKLDIQNKSMAAEKLIYDGKCNSKIKVSRQVRLKSQQINQTLINHCRSFIILTDKQEFITAKITIPFSVEFQVKMLKLYKQILNTLLNSYMTSLEEDQQLLSKSNGNYKAMMAIRLKISYKRILNDQLQLVEKCQQFLKRWKNGRLQINQKEMIWVKKTIWYLRQLERSKI